MCKSGRGAEGGRKWNLFSDSIWGCLANQITAKVQELRPAFNEDVQRNLDGACDMYRVEIRGLMLSFQDPYQVSRNNMRDVVSAADSRLIEQWKKRSSRNVLDLLNEEVLGLTGELGGSRNNNQQFREKQMRMEQRMEEEIWRMGK